MNNVSEESIYKRNLAVYQERINNFTYFLCIASAVSSLLFLISMMEMGIFKHIHWSNIFGLLKYFAVTISIPTIFYFTLKKYRDNPTLISCFKYCLIACSYINYMGIVGNIPYREAWGTVFFSLFLSALYLDFFALSFSVVLCIAINIISYFINSYYSPSSNVLSELILRSLSMSFGILGTFLTLWF